VSPSRRQRALPALAVLSGVAALVYQALWVKQLTLVVGIAVHAVALGVSAFFAGLGAGSVLLGRLADRSSSPWRLLAGLEGGIALSAVAATLLLSRSAGPFVALADALGPAAHLLPALLVGAPALLMGGTLPALVRTAAPPDGALGRAAGGLYAWNTLGGALGVLLVPFALLPALGVRGSALAAAALNLAVAAAAWRLAGPQRAASGRPLRPLPWPRSAWPALAIYAAAGALALGYEVAWTQLLAPLVSTRTFAFAIVLATYLLGLVLGSALHARVADRVRDPWAALGALLAGAAISAAGLSALVGPWLPAAQAALGELVQAGTGSVAAAMLARFALAAVAVLLLPCILLGAAFPAAVRLVARADAVGRGVGWTAGLNTAGGILGSLVTGFVLVPWLGAARALGLLALAGGALGAAAILRGAGARGARLAWACGLIAAAAAPLALTPPDASARLLAATRGGRVEFQAESVAGTVAVLSQRSPASRTRATSCRPAATCGFRPCFRSSCTAASRARRWSSRWARASPAARCSRTSRWNGAPASSCSRRSSRRAGSSRATSAPRTTRASTCASPTDATSCCARTRPGT
jgi:spermidine synthase